MTIPGAKLKNAYIFDFYGASNLFCLSENSLKMLFNGLLRMSPPYVKQPVKAHFIDGATWLAFSRRASLMRMASEHKGDQAPTVPLSFHSLCFFSHFIPLQPD